MIFATKTEPKHRLDTYSVARIRLYVGSDNEFICHSR